MEEYPKQRCPALPLLDWVETWKPLKWLSHQPTVNTKQWYAVYEDEMESMAKEKYRQQDTPGRSDAEMWSEANTQFHTQNMKRADLQDPHMPLRYTQVTITPWSIFMGVG